MPSTDLVAPLLANLDASTLEFLWSSCLVALVLAGGAAALALLPWSEDELVAVDAEARALAKAPVLGPRRAPAVLRS